MQLKCLVTLVFPKKTFSQSLNWLDFVTDQVNNRLENLFQNLTVMASIPVIAFLNIYLFIYKHLGMTVHGEQIIGLEVP